MVSDVDVLELTRVNYLALVPMKCDCRRHDEKQRFDDPRCRQHDLRPDIDVRAAMLRTARGHKLPHDVPAR